METFEKPFPHGFIHAEYGDGSVPKSVDELDMIRLSISIREKPNWSDKMNDPTIVAKWRAEVADTMTQSDKKFDYVLAELGKWIRGLIYSSCICNKLKFYRRSLLVDQRWID